MCFDEARQLKIDPQNRFRGAEAGDPMIRTCGSASARDWNLMKAISGFNALDGRIEYSNEYQSRKW
jgi:hypothetical protein